MKSFSLILFTLFSLLISSYATSNNTTSCVTGQLICEESLSTTAILSVGYVGGICSLIAVVILTVYVMKQPEGNDEDADMKAIAQFVHDGARTFLHWEYVWLSLFVVLVCIILAVIFALLDNADNLAALFVVLSVLFGAILSSLAGYLGMYIATKANIRTTHACRTGMGTGLSVAFKSGAVMGLTVTGLGLLGLAILYTAFEGLSNEWNYIAGFGFGASSIALFARVGGGVYTKAADVGADLVGKVEKNIPEDDPRNPAVIADNVGDNVGDVAGMGADLFESYAGSIIAACTLAHHHITNYSDANSGIVNIYGNKLGQSYGKAAIALPFWIAGAGILCSLVGVFVVRTSDEKEEEKTNENKVLSDAEKKEAQIKKSEEDMQQLEDLLNITRRGIAVAGLLVLIVSAIICYILFAGSGFEASLFFCILTGLACGILIGLFTEYCTSYSYRPTQTIAEMSRTGPATVIIQGMGIGMISCAVPVILLVFAILISNSLAGIYGISIAAVGMLSTLGITLATDAYGPVSDNAGGIAEMAGMPAIVRERTDALDALGNTTAATGKGFAIGSAVLTSVGLIAAYMEEAGLNLSQNSSDLSLANPTILVGILIGAMLPFIFAALTMLSVGRSAEAIILIVRVQFYLAEKAIANGEYKDEGFNTWEEFNPVKMKDLEKRDAYYKECIKIATNSALKEMLIPGLMAVFVPAIIGFILGAAALAGLLGGALTSGFMLAVTMANAGGAWDNAKKYCEKGALGEGKGKGTEFHEATVVGDTVGDPFKDTSGPALNILIKLMSIVSLVLAPVFRSVSPTPYTVEGTITGVIIFIVITVLCIVIQMMMNKANEAFKEEVEAKKNERNANQNGLPKPVAADNILPVNDEKKPDVAPEVETKDVVPEINESK